MSAKEKEIRAHREFLRQRVVKAYAISRKHLPDVALVLTKESSLKRDWDLAFDVINPEVSERLPSSRIYFKVIGSGLPKRYTKNGICIHEIKAEITPRMLSFLIRTFLFDYKTPIDDYKKFYLKLVANYGGASVGKFHNSIPSPYETIVESALVRLMEEDEIFGFSHFSKWSEVDHTGVDFHVYPDANSAVCINLQVKSYSRGQILHFEHKHQGQEILVLPISWTFTIDEVYNFIKFMFERKIEALSSENSVLDIVTSNALATLSVLSKMKIFDEISYYSYIGQGIFEVTGPAENVISFALETDHVSDKIRRMILRKLYPYVRPEVAMD